MPLWGDRSCSQPQSRRMLHLPDDSEQQEHGGISGESIAYLSSCPGEGERASGCLDVQSSGGNATRQNVGRGSENSKPISALPARTGPRNTTWHSCSSWVRLCCMKTLLPLVSASAHQDQRSMCVDGQRLGLFHELLALRVRAANAHGHLHQHSLAAAAQPRDCGNLYGLVPYHLSKSTIPGRTLLSSVKTAIGT